MWRSGQQWREMLISWNTFLTTMIMSYLSVNISMTFWQHSTQMKQKNLSRQLIGRGNSTTSRTMTSRSSLLLRWNSRLIVYSTIKVRQLFKIIIVTPGRVLSLIKKKATGKKEIRPRLELPADLVAFADPPRRVRRLNPRDFSGANVIRRRQLDQPMEDASNDEEEEKNNASP